MEKLIDQYERSKTYRGTNQLTQSFSVAPERIFTQYDSDYADVNQIHDFENMGYMLQEKKKLEQEIISWMER